MEDSQDTQHSGTLSSPTKQSFTQKTGAWIKKNIIRRDDESLLDEHFVARTVCKIRTIFLTDCSIRAESSNITIEMLRLKGKNSLKMG